MSASSTLPNGALRDRLQRALLVRRLAAVAERELQREDPDDPVDHAARDEAGACQPLEAVGARDPFSLVLGLADRRTTLRRHAHVLIPLRRALAGRTAAAHPARPSTLNVFTFVRSPPSSS